MQCRARTSRGIPYVNRVGRERWIHPLMQHAIHGAYAALVVVVIRDAVVSDMAVTMVSCVIDNVFGVRDMAVIVDDVIVVGLADMRDVFCCGCDVYGCYGVYECV